MLKKILDMIFKPKSVEVTPVIVTEQPVIVTEQPVHAVKDLVSKPVTTKLKRTRKKKTN
jgi:hypothetical protein